MSPRRVYDSLMKAAARLTLMGWGKDYNSHYYYYIL